MNPREVSPREKIAMAPHMLRVLAIAIAICGLIDPVLAIRRPQPVRVEIRAASAPAQAVRARLLADLEGHVVAISGGDAATAVSGGDAAAAVSDNAAAAVVLIGDRVDAGYISDGRPISVVMPAAPAAPNVRIVAAAAPAPVLPGQSAVVSAAFHGRGAAGKTSVLVLEEDGVQLARAEHHWSKDDERFDARLEYAPPAPGVHVVSVRALPFDGESTADDNSADLPLVATPRVLRVVAYEARPSWAAAFVRRALEADPAFDVASLVRASRGLEVRGGSAPPALTSAALERFDAVLIGAPEELTGADVAALTWFVRVRGGAVVFLPDRRPGGPYVGMLPDVLGGGFDEVLLDTPAALLAEHSSGLKASELALPRRMRGGVAPHGGIGLASVAHGGTMRPAIVSWPHGAGRIVFSGALDAWRYRARDDEAFGRFWTGVIANVAAASPGALTVSVHPAVAATGESLTVRARVRSTEFSTGGSRVDVPPVEARLIASDGSQQWIRLWPATEAGVYEGAIVPPSDGKYDVQVKSGHSTMGAEADVAVLVSSAVRHPVPNDVDGAALVARASGGIVTTGADLRPLEAHLRGLARDTAVVSRRPTRSPWWLAAFAAALCAEWTLRRRKGLR